VSHPEDDKLNLPDFELPGPQAAPEGDLAPTMDFGAPPAEAGPAPDAVPGDSMPAEEPLGGLGELGVSSEPAGEGEPSEAGEMGQLPDFGGQSPAAEEITSKKKKKKGKVSKTGDSEEGEEGAESIWQRLVKTSPYTVMLWISFLGLIVGTVFLYLEMKTYKFDLKATEAKVRGRTTAVQLGPSPSAHNV
jgi:hypothetical protein